MKYDLDKLGCVEFEGLCQTLLKAKLGMGIEAWGGTGDWGCDSYYEDSLQYPTRKMEKGPFVFQAKFVSGANAAGAKSDRNLLASVERECVRISARLQPQGNRKTAKWATTPNHYSLLTNAPISPVLREKIREKIRSVLPFTDVHCHCGADICAWLANKLEIIPAFPQLLTITNWKDFIHSAIHAGVFMRSKTALSLAEQAAKIFVPTRPYYEAQGKLREHHFVVLEGPPEMGKTTIGRMIATAQSALGWDAIECRSPKELLDVSDPDRSQVFIGDDFFGRGEYEPSRMSQWEGELPFILDQLNKNHWLILTSRAHILKIAKRHLDISGQNHRFPHLGEVIVNAGNLSPIEKGKILYRHAKSANLPANIRQQLRSEATSIVGNPHFTPLRIKNFVHALKEHASNEVV